MYQQITIVGNLGQDPEMRYTKDGTPVTNFSVATNRKWNNNDGTKGEEVCWFRVTAWRRMAEVCNEYLSKGRSVMVVGRLNPDESGNPKTFTRNDGSSGAKFELTAQTVKFLGAPQNAAPSGTSLDGPPTRPVDLGDDSIPF